MRRDRCRRRRRRPVRRPYRSRSSCRRRSGRAGQPLRHCRLQTRRPRRRCASCSVFSGCASKACFSHLAVIVFGHGSIVFKIAAQNAANGFSRESPAASESASGANVRCVRGICRRAAKFALPDRVAPASSSSSHWRSAVSTNSSATPCVRNSCARRALPKRARAHSGARHSVRRTAVVVLSGRRAVVQVAPLISACGASLRDSSARACSRRANSRKARSRSVLRIIRPALLVTPPLGAPLAAVAG